MSQNRTTLTDEDTIGRLLLRAELQLELEDWALRTYYRDAGEYVLNIWPKKDAQPPQYPWYNRGGYVLTKDLMKKLESQGFILVGPARGGSDTIRLTPHGRTWAQSLMD